MNENIELKSINPKLGFIAEKKPKVYTNSKEDVGEASKSFALGELVEYINADAEWQKGTLANIVVWDNLPYRVIEGKGESYKMRKLQKTEPANPYEEIEEDGKYKVVETGWTCNFLVINYNDAQDVLSSWVNHKDFEGFLFGDEDEYWTGDTCWSGHAGHAIGVKFRTNKGEE